jgi:hypothetical protein
MPVDNGPVGRRRAILRVASALSALVALMYLAFAAVVRNADGGLTAYGTYAALGALYVVGSVALARSDSRAFEVVGALAQAVVILAFLVLGVGAFQKDLLGGPSVVLWAGAITGCQAILMALLIHLAYSRRSP